MNKKIIVVITLALCSIANTAYAGPSEYVYSATVEPGEREIDFKFGRRSMNNRTANQSATSIGYGYGVNENWFTELYVKYVKEYNETMQFDALEWENRFQLTETGKYPLEVGFLVEVERPKNRSEGFEVQWGPLFQTDFGKTQWNANFLFNRNYGADIPTNTSAYYQLQGKYRYRRDFEFGFQAFGDLGQWDHWSSTRNQGHRLGPAIFGKISLDNKQALKYNAAYLIGKNSINGEGIRGNTLRLQLEYEF